MSILAKSFNQTLKEGIPLFLLGILLIALTDSIGSILSRQPNFDYYTYLYPISYLIFTLVPFFIAKKTNLKTAITYAALLGLFDASIGWWILTVLHANVAGVTYEFTVGRWIMIALMMMTTGAFWGFLGALAAKLIFKSRKITQYGRDNRDN